MEKQLGILVIAIIAMTGFLWGGNLLYKFYRLKKFGECVEGITLEPKKSEGDIDSSDSYTTIVSYSVNSKTYRIHGKHTSSSYSAHCSGRKVLVYFYPDKPGKGQLLESWEPIIYSALILGSFLPAAVVVAWLTGHGK